MDGVHHSFDAGRNQAADCRRDRLGGPCTDAQSSRRAGRGKIRPRPRVSFVVTSYNKADYLPAVLETVWAEAQSVDGEVILIDDGSNDGSAEICEQFASAHPSAVFWRQSNVGVFETLNRAVPRALSEWIRFCDSDDPIIPGSTERLVMAADRFDVPAAYGRSISYGPGPVFPSEASKQTRTAARVGLHEDGALYLVKRMGFVPSAAIYRTEALIRLFPLPKHFVSCQDLAVTLAAVGRKGLAWTDYPACFHLTGTPAQLSSNRVLMWHQITRIIQHFAPCLEPHHRRAAVIKAAHRAMRYQRTGKSGLRSLLARLWLFSLIARAKLGLCRAGSALDAIATSYERELGPLIEGRQRVY